MDHLRSPGGRKNPTREAQAADRYCPYSALRIFSRLQYVIPDRLVSERRLDSLRRRQTWTHAYFSRGTISTIALSADSFCVRLLERWRAGLRRDSQHGSCASRMAVALLRYRDWRRESNRGSRSAALSVVH